LIPLDNFGLTRPDEASYNMRYAPLRGLIVVRTQEKNVA
jgi:hypothetical protein